MIHTAVLSDRPDFLRLWAEYMTEQEKEGNHMLANTQNLYHQLEVFESYVTGGTNGVCLFWETAEKERVAVILVGEFAGLDEWETDMGKIATIWGTYVQPAYRRQRIGLKLTQKGLEIGREMGFDTIETYIRIDNPHSLQIVEICGFAPCAQQCLVSLRDLKILDNDEAR